MIGFHDILLQQLEVAVGEGWNVNTKLGKIFEEMVIIIKAKSKGKY